jgi:hypothetical protein
MTREFEVRSTVWKFILSEPENYDNNKSISSNSNNTTYNTGIL